METNATTPDPQGATPSGSAPTGATPTPSPTGATPAKPAMTIEDALAKIAELERHATNKTEEAARHGKNLSTAEKELAAYKEKERLAQEATLSEVEKANKRVADTEQRHQEAQTQIKQLQQQLVMMETKFLAQGMNFHSPDMAAKMVQEYLEFDENGKPTNLEKALKTFAQNNPFMIKSAAPAETPAPASPVQSAPTTRTPAIPAMNPGRSSIAAPNSTPPGQIPRLSDVYRQSRR